MAEEKTGPTSEVNLYARLPEALVREFDVACARLGIKRPEGIRRAIEHWLQPPKRAEQSARSESTDPRFQKLQQHSHLLELLADAARHDLDDMQTYLEMRREVRKKKAPKE